MKILKLTPFRERLPKIAVGAMTYVAALISSGYCCLETANYLGSFIYPIPTKKNAECFEYKGFYFGSIDKNKYNELSSF